MEDTKDIVMDDDFGFDPADFGGADEADGNQTGSEQLDPETQDEPDTGNPTEPPETEQPHDEGEEKPAEPGSKPADGEPETYELKVLGETRKVSLEEMKALAQMGADRDRIIQQRDNLAQFRAQYGGTIAELESLAQSMNTDVPGLLASMQTSMLVQNGMSREAAEQKVRADRFERQVNAGKQQQTRQEQVRQMQERDIQAFVQKHPGLDPKTIPQSVWDAVRGGETLVNAYDRYEMQQVQAENRQLRERVAALEQNNTNKEKSLGSMKTAGKSPVEDDFMKGLDEAW